MTTSDSIHTCAMGGVGGYCGSQLVPVAHTRAIAGAVAAGVAVPVAPLNVKIPLNVKTPLNVKNNLR